MVLGYLSSLILSYSTRLEILLVYCLLGGLYLYYVASKTEAGTMKRTVASIPILIGNMSVPFLFDPKKEVCTAMAICFLLAWLGTFKVHVLDAIISIVLLDAQSLTAWSSSLTCLNYCFL